MADNYLATQGAGTTFKAKDVGGVLHPGLVLYDEAGAVKTGWAATEADGANAALGATTDAAVTTDAAGTLSAKLRGLVAWAAAKMPAALGQAAMAASLPVALASDQSVLQVKGGAFNYHVALTVTNGVYTIGDVVGGLITITGAARASGGSALINSLLLGGVVANPYTLWLWNADLATANVADNGVMAVVVADSPKYLGHIPIVPSDYKAGVSAFNFASLKGLGLQYKATATTIYAYLMADAVTSPGTTNLDLTLAGEYLD